MLATDYDKTELKHLPKIVIEAIPHDSQRYETCGDWFYDDSGTLHIKVSETTPKYEFLVALHELVEAMLCNFKGVKEQDVTNFDVKFEEMRESYPNIVGDKEPGEEDAAPYVHEHRIASRIERFIARDMLGANPDEEWRRYEETINKLSKF